MANETRNQLKQAYTYIQQERLDEAITILRRVLNNDPDNADAWWLMANAVSEPAEAAEALTNVLRLRPDHAEAREAYQQLIAEYPDLAPSQPIAPAFDPSSFSFTDYPEFTSKPPAEPAFDVGDFNIDDLLARSPAPEAQSVTWTPATDDFSVTAWSMPETSAAQSNLDLDELFGGKASVDVPSTPTEEDDLRTVFGMTAEAQQIRRQGAPDLPSERSQSAPSEPRSDHAETVAGLEALLEARAEPQSAPAEQTRSEAELDAELDAIFSSEPAFVGQIAQQEEKQRGRRGRRKKEQQPTTFEYGEPEPAAPTQPTVPERERERRPKSGRLVAEAPAYDPFATERRANRRSPIWALLSLLVIVIAILALVALIVPLLAPDPVTQALRNAQQSLAQRGFAQPATSREGDTFRLTICGSSGRALQSRVYEAMELVADHVVAAGEPIKAVQLTVVDCADANVILYRATATAESVRRYLEGGKADVRTYRASWR